MRAGDVWVTRHLLMGVPQVSPLFPYSFIVFIQVLLDRFGGVSDHSEQAFADDIIACWILYLGRSSREISSELGQ